MSQKEERLERHVDYIKNDILISIGEVHEL